MSILSVCFLTGLVCYQFFKIPTKVMFLYVVITFLTEMLGYYSLYLSPEKKVNVLLYNLYAPLSFGILSLFFYLIIENQTLKKGIMFVTSMVLIIIISFSFADSNQQINFRLLLFSFAVLTIYAVLFLRQILHSDENIYPNPYFWMVTGILFFYGGYFFLSGFINYISSKDPIFARKLFFINHLLNIIYYSLITYGFICQRK